MYQLVIQLISTRLDHLQITKCEKPPKLKFSTLTIGHDREAELVKTRQSSNKL